MNGHEAIGTVPEGPPAPLSVAVIGDVRVEVRARLREQAFENTHVDHLEFTPVNAVLAGTAINFAKQAVRWFGAVHVISRIGRDHHTDDIVRYLSRLVTSCHLPTSAGTANGRTIVLRDRNARRIIAADDTTPIRELSVTDIEEARGTISGSDAVFADGYLLLAEPSRTAVTAAMKIANEHGTVFWLDLVPHDMDRYLDLDAIEPLIMRADIIVSQARTMAALLGLPDQYPYRESGFPDLLAALAKLSDSCTWYLRHGDHDISKVLVSRAGRRVRAYGTGFVEEKSMAGFGDRVTAAEMHDYMRRQHAGAD